MTVAESVWMSNIHFQRVAVTEDQIDTWHLPTRPTKATDSRAKAFGSRSVEVDAIPASTLRWFVEWHIKQHVDTDQLKALETAEQSERQLLNQITKHIKPALNSLGRLAQPTRAGCPVRVRLGTSGED